MSLTGTQMDLVLRFSLSLMAVKGRIELIKTNQRPEDVNEVEGQITVFVRDTAKKHLAMNHDLHAERAEDPIDAEVWEVQSTYSPPLTLCNYRTITRSFSSGQIRLCFSVPPKADQDPHYSTNRGKERQGPLLALPMV